MGISSRPQTQSRKPCNAITSMPSTAVRRRSTCRSLSRIPARAVHLKPRERSKGRFRSRTRVVQRRRDIRQQKRTLRSPSPQGHTICTSPATHLARSPMEQRKKAGRLALTVIAALPLPRQVRSAIASKMSTPRDEDCGSKHLLKTPERRRALAVASPQAPRDEDGGSKHLLKTPERRRALAVASPQFQRKCSDRRAWSDPEGDWSRELRAWSPERREEQAKRRAMAEALLKAKEEEEEKQRVVDLEDSEHETLSTDAAQTMDMSSQPPTPNRMEAAPLSCTGTPDENSSVAQTLAKTCPRATASDTDVVEALPVNAAIEEAAVSIAEDIPLNDVAEVPAEQVDVTTLLGELDKQIHHTDEVASLLEELAASAGSFDARDYWSGGAWNLEGLREDVEELRQERWSYEESLWRNDALRSEPASADRRASCTCDFSPEMEPMQASPHQVRSPEFVYPIFSKPTPLRLTFLEPESATMPRRIGYRRTFAKRSFRSSSNRVLGWRLRRMLNKP